MQDIDRCGRDLPELASVVALGHHIQVVLLDRADGVSHLDRGFTLVTVLDPVVGSERVAQDIFFESDVGVYSDGTQAGS